MAISTNAELKTAVASWLHRSDLTTTIPDFIALCESDLRRDLRVREMEASTSVAITSTTLAIPTGFIEARKLTLNDIELDYVEPGYFTSISDDTTYNYTTQGANFLFQTSAGTVKVYYYSAFAALSADADTNWLLTTHPDAYLFGSLSWAAVYTQQDPAQWRTLYRSAIDRIRTTQRNAIPSLVVRPDSGNTP